MHPAEAYEAGWLVHSWENPEDVLIVKGVTYDF
jgi:hypothetical protein